MQRAMTRRKFLWVTSVSAAGVAAGCAVNPVTGKSQLMLMSEQQEIDLDRQYAPQQFSTDYGIVQDSSLNTYIGTVGKQMSSLTHRPDMPYSFQVVNATYVNAYAFPGGSIACTRGILLSMENEAELAALLGHELGHVNARHTAERMTKSQLTQVLVGGLTMAVGMKYEKYAGIASQVGMLGAGMLLAHYSRENERQADELGMEYMVKTQYAPKGMVELMDILRSLHKGKPSVIETMFSSHPMSEERYQTAVSRAKSEYGYADNYPVQRDRYMDNTQKLRQQKGAVDEMQKGEAAMSQKKYNEAQAHFQKALNMLPDDYTGLIMMAKCHLIQQKYMDARQYLKDAKSVYPQEPQAYYLSGFTQMQLKEYEAAYEDFSTYDNRLPGNPNTGFFKGYSLEGMQHIDQAANEYKQYLGIVQEGEQAEHAYQRLVEWGYVKK